MCNSVASFKSWPVFFFSREITETNGCLEQKKSKKLNEMYEMF